METNTNASLAGDSASPESNFLSDDAAASLMEGLLGPEDEEDTGAAAPDQNQDQSAEEAPATEDDESAQPAEEAEPETSDEEPPVAHGNMKTRLRDGTELTVAELKKSFDEAQELRAQAAQWTAQQQQFQQQAQRVAQQAQFFDQAIQAAIAIQQQAMPAAPDPSLRDTDPIEYFTQKDRYEGERQKLVSLMNQQQAARAEAQRNMQFEQQKIQQTQAAKQQDYIKDQQRMLLEKMPELKQPEVARKFYNDFVEGGQKHYGFTTEELNKTYDSRLLAVMKDALAYRALQSKTPAVQAKAKNAAPVQPAGRQVTRNETQSRDFQSKMDKLRKSGSQDDAASLLMDLL